MVYLNKIVPIFLLFVFISINGCGLTFSGNKDDVYFYSTPYGAEVYINGDYMGETPLPLTLKSDKDYVVEFRKKGYKKEIRLINSSVAGGYVILDVILGFFPVIIDAATGGWYTLDEEYVDAELETTTEAAERKKDQAELAERSRQKELEIKRDSLSSTDRDKIILEISALQNEIKILDEEDNNAFKRNIEYIDMANKLIALTKNEHKLMEKYKRKAWFATVKGIKIRKNLSSLRKQLNDLYDLVPELRQ